MTTRTPDARRRKNDGRGEPPGRGPAPGSAGIAIRAEQRDLFAPVLRSKPSRRGKPYSERTIGTYLDAVDSLDRRLTETGHPGGFDSLALRQLNAYLGDYLDRHTLGGTVTKQGNLRVFLKHLADEYGGEDLWQDPKRHRFQRQDNLPRCWPRH